MSTVTVILDQTETTFELDENSETILGTALDKGLDAPYSCRGGVCTTCKAKLLEGKVKMDANYALTDKEIAQGYILACQSHPITPVVRITWDD
ncbi:MAG: 2Fe-2S iron-sulfur cluster binding domain-containing protein [Flavobacteriales bacterium]|mgnify:CR=1 FL=1|nr:2Fe-2S iron-sulfur cluster binding domain-containing protein [Flavobacteriales bacterium]